MLKKRILKNTVFLYIRQIFIVFVNIYIIRVLLDVFGINDYAIYSVVAGLVAFGTFFSSSMSSATQRYFSFGLGADDLHYLKKIFNINIFIYLVIAFLFCILMFGIGKPMVENILDFDQSRRLAAVNLFYFVALTFLLNILASPFIAIINAHEDIHIYATISVLESLLKLLASLALHYINEPLVAYGQLLCFISLINFILYLLICIKKYPECRYRKYDLDKNLLKDVIGYTSWTLFGQFTTVIRNHGLTIVTNQFFNPIIVVARSIALSVSNQVLVLATNFNKSLYPPIIKSYAKNDHHEMQNLIFEGSKLTFYLMWLIALPVFIFIDDIYSIWLKSHPYEAILFSRLIIIELLIVTLAYPIMAGARAPGRVKEFEIILGTIQIVSFFIAFYVVYIGFPAYSIFIIGILTNLVMFIARLYITRWLVGLSIKGFFYDVVIKIFYIVILSSAFSFLLLNNIYLDSILKKLISVLVISLFSLFLFFNLGLSNDSKKAIILKLKYGLKINI